MALKFAIRYALLCPGTNSREELVPSPAAPCRISGGNLLCKPKTFLLINFQISHFTFKDKISNNQILFD
jgi:hypothetical protein